MTARCETAVRRIEQPDSKLFVGADHAGVQQRDVDDFRRNVAVIP